MAQEPHEGDEAARRSRAGDLSVRRADLSRRRRAGAVRRPSARRSRARAGAEGQLSARDRPRSGSGRSSRCCPAAGRTRSSGCCRSCAMRWRTIAAQLPAGAVRHRARALARRSAVFEHRSGAALRPVEVLARTDDVLAISDVAITASGTATVQAALHGRPMVVVYRLSPLTYRLGRRFLLRRERRDGQPDRRAGGSCPS